MSAGLMGCVCAWVSWYAEARGVGVCVLGLRYPAGHGHVEITLGADAIMLSADEQGFSAADVRAVCSMGDSTKRMRADQTGRMGE